MTKLAVVTEQHARAFGTAGLTLVCSFSCYSAVGSNTGGIGIRPVGADGLPIGSVEWYEGLVPGDPVLEDARADEFRHQIERGLAPLFVLDFLRWPGHWETQSRHGAAPPATSFDPETLRRFAEWARGNGIEHTGIDPDDASLSSSVLLSDLRPEWLEFRAQLVTRFAARLAEIAHGNSVDVGAFLVPVPEPQRHEVYGQDAAAMARDLDLFVPMTYHAITGHDAQWSRDFGIATARTTARPVIAMIQLTSSHGYSDGWDWGAQIDSWEVRRTMTEIEGDIRSGALAGYCVFPGEASMADSEPVTRPPYRRDPTCDH